MTFVTAIAPLIKVVATDVAFVQGNFMGRMALIRFVEAFVTNGEWFFMDEKTFLGRGATSSI
jgi:hypothetical protein